MLQEKILAIDELIDAMLLNMVGSIDESGTASFTLDDGQMKISTEYRSISDIEKGIWALERMKQRYLSNINGRVTVLRGRLNY